MCKDRRIANNLLKTPIAFTTTPTLTAPALVTETTVRAAWAANKPKHPFSAKTAPSELTMTNTTLWNNKIIYKIILINKLEWVIIVWEGIHFTFLIINFKSRVENLIINQWEEGKESRLMLDLLNKCTNNNNLINHKISKTKKSRQCKVVII